VTEAASSDPARFRLLACFLAGGPVDVTAAAAGEAAHTNGQTIFVTADESFDDQRREVLLQSALLGAGSLDRSYVQALRGRPTAARRYLSLEGHRVLADLAFHLPLAAAVCPDGTPSTTSAEHSLTMATGRAQVAQPPPWFGTIKPSKLLRAPAASASAATEQDLRLQIDAATPTEEEDEDDDDPSEKSKILQLFSFPVGAKATAEFLRKLFGSSRSSGSESAGGEMDISIIRRSTEVSAFARPTPTRIQFTDDDRAGAALGVGGALHPEWDVFRNRYRPEWCRVIDFPVTDQVDPTGVAVARDAVLRRRLARVGLGRKVLRGRADGDDLDTEALIDLQVDLRSGYSSSENVYTERRKLARNLGVLILIDASGSASDADPEGLAVHDHQRRAAATLAATLEELGDRVAVYAFRSHGRQAVHLPSIKTFGQRFDAISRARLGQLQPSGYTRLGAAIRGASEILKTEAGTPHRLLLILSDGFPYDVGYEGRYAEADATKALEDLRADGVAALCLSVGADAKPDALERVFGSVSFAAGATLAELSPRMDELFLGALRELAAPLSLTARAAPARAAR
jgi:nitric oxide reductase NorD protein